MFFAIMYGFKISTRVTLTAATKVPTGAKHTLLQFNFAIMYFSIKRLAKPPFFFYQFEIWMLMRCFKPATQACGKLMFYRSCV